MNKRFCRIVLLLTVFSPYLLWATPPVIGQIHFTLNIETHDEQRLVIVTGATGAVCQIQYAENLATSNPWRHLGFLVFTDSTANFIDFPSPSVTQRYYRAVWTPNTNLVWISPGTFIMGSPTNEALRALDETQHSVMISQGFWMEKNQVRQEDYLSVMGSNPSRFIGDLSRPVEQVSWNDATNYCTKRTQQERAADLIPTNYVYRLPTEAEWEYASRAGTTTAFSLGSSLHSGQANFYGQVEYDAGTGEIYNPNGTFAGTTTPVASYPANGWGLFDMIGNVWEWCQDWYGIYPDGSVTDPRGPTTGSYRVFRGGKWNAYATYCRSAFRSSAPPFAFFDFGLRVVLAPIP